MGVCHLYVLFIQCILLTSSKAVSESDDRFFSLACTQKDASCTLEESDKSNSAFWTWLDSLGHLFSEHVCSHAMLNESECCIKETKNVQSTFNNETETQSNKNNRSGVACKPFKTEQHKRHFVCNFKSLFPALCTEKQKHHIILALLGALLGVVTLGAATAVVVFFRWRSRRSAKRTAKAKTEHETTLSNTLGFANVSFVPDGAKEHIEGAASNRSKVALRYCDSGPMAVTNADMDEAVYHEIDDIAYRKLPPTPASKDDTSPAEALAKGGYSLARSLPADDSHNETIAPSSDAVNPMVHATTGTVNSTSGCTPDGVEEKRHRVEICFTPHYFVLEAETAAVIGSDDTLEQTPSKSLQHCQDAKHQRLGDVAKICESSDYSHLDLCDRESNPSPQETQYTSLGQASGDGANSQAARDDQGNQEGQYFILEKEENEKSEPDGDKKYFILEAEVKADSEVN